ncbi:hypothetical protein XENTR_v10023710 [Xenopus tropicalis]|uniref:TBC1 domain family member 10B n=1 Tax=Xenopus tropicalis TaxID=8364 RepID=A0A6I8RNY1_XENTR|nr:TBC1 domain family member 10B [Xenopus tropicalis]KAE8578641.1 hypothetical protein XENTR_v10023710 [Xenopus tropicalis]
MELPPGRGSSPPGPRPIPPPRKSSMDRRTLSPARREAKGNAAGDVSVGEQRAFWERVSDVNGSGDSVAKGKLPDTPEKADQDGSEKGHRKDGSVTQRVVIVMQSRATTSAGNLGHSAALESGDTTAGDAKSCDVQQHLHPDEQIGITQPRVQGHSATPVPAQPDPQPHGVLPQDSTAQGSLQPESVSHDTAPPQHQLTLGTEGQITCHPDGEKQWVPQTDGAKVQQESVSHGAAPPQHQLTLGTQSEGQITCHPDGGKQWVPQKDSAKVQQESVSHGAAPPQHQPILGTQSEGQITCHPDGGKQWLPQKDGAIAQQESVSHGAPPQHQPILGTQSEGQITCHPHGGKQSVPQTDGAIAQQESVSHGAPPQHQPVLGTQSEGQITCHPDGGKQWVPQTDGAIAQQESVSHKLIQVILGTESEGQITCHPDGGKQWVPQTDGAIAQQESVSHKLIQVILGTESEGQITCHPDGGKQWVPQKDSAIVQQESDSQIKVQPNREVQVTAPQDSRNHVAFPPQLDVSGPAQQQQQRDSCVPDSTSQETVAQPVSAKQLDSASPAAPQQDSPTEPKPAVSTESHVSVQLSIVIQGKETAQQDGGASESVGAQGGVQQCSEHPPAVLPRQDGMAPSEEALQLTNVILPQGSVMQDSVPQAQDSVMQGNVTKPQESTTQKDGTAVQDSAVTSVQSPPLQNSIKGSPADQPSTSSGPSHSSPGTAPVAAPEGTALSPMRVNELSSPQRNISAKPPLPTPIRSNLYPGPQLPAHDPDSSLRSETASLSSYRMKAPAPDTLSYLDSVSLMSGTLESLTLMDDASSLGSDSEINGIPYRKTDKYGFLGGNQYSGNGEGFLSVEISRQRELKWLDMFSHWDKWLSRRFQKVKLRCRKGIPSSLRAKAWQLLSNSEELLRKNPGKFEEMERQPGDPKWLDVIEKDLHRQFPFHEMFAARGGHGQQDLYRILKAYTVYRPEEGYCQAQAPVAAVLLMHMPAEQAFWCLVQICDKYLPGYYSAGLEAIQLDGEIFFALLRRVCPMAYRHLKKFKIDPILYMTEWFMCIFSRTLPWASVLRVWDMFFCEGIKIVFRVGLVLLKHTLGSVDKLRSCQGMYETMEKLRSLPPQYMNEDFLLPEISSLPITDVLIERESTTQLRKWRENRGELQYRPSRRLHGARQIHEEKVRLNPSLSGSRLSLSSLRRPSPPPTTALLPESVVVSEGLRPALPSPTSNKTPLVPPKESGKRTKEKQREQEKKEKEEKERERKREKEEKQKEKEREKLREREEKQREKERRAQKEKEKADGKQKKERKFSFRRKDPSTPAAADAPKKTGKGAADSAAGAGAVHDTYF